MNNALIADPRLIVAFCQGTTFDMLANKSDVRHQQPHVLADVLKNAFRALNHLFQKQPAETNVVAVGRKQLAGELYGMSVRELNDIGLSRSDIPDVVNGTYVADRRISVIAFPSRTPAPETAIHPKLAA